MCSTCAAGHASRAWKDLVSFSELIERDRTEAVVAALSSAAALTTLNLACTKIPPEEKQRVASGLAPLRGQLVPVRVPGAARKAAQLRAASAPVAAAQGTLDLTAVGIFSGYT